MTKRTRVLAVLFTAVLFGSLTIAQEPVQDIDRNIHPNLAEAQRCVVEANQFINAAQKDNGYDMRGHAERARQLLVQVNNELKAAALAANAAHHH
jgi:uncharacterized protein YbaP (TraB family)